ncbi:MAG TPA: hypothetical protein VFD48_15455, partial [Pyrinomonadaceae bacterium]|nr:hypothetical protein [Pyrinomonadaceae bacterium]
CLKSLVSFALKLGVKIGINILAHLSLLRRSSMFIAWGQLVKGSLRQERQPSVLVRCTPPERQFVT